MDDLTTLKRFRAEVGGAAAGDPAHERTMAAIRALVEKESAEVSRATRPRGRLWHLPKPTLAPRRRLLVAGLLAAAIAAAIAVLPTRQSSPSLVGQALAAIGSGSVLHIVGEMPTGRLLLDLQSGHTTPVVQQEEIWFDEGHGLRRDVTRIGGTIVDDTFQSQAGGWTPYGVIYDCTWIAAHPKAATKARVSCNASGDNGTTPMVVPRPKPTLDPGLAGFADGYRSALASGAARESGNGVVDGHAVDWLVFDTKQGPERVALDAATHKPIVIDGPNSLTLRITTIETTDSADGHFRKPSPDETPSGPTRGESIDRQKLALDGAAIGAAYPSGVWAGLSVGGLPLASATLQRLVSSYYQDLRPQQTGVGLQLQYGSLTANGHHDFTRPYVTVSEAPSPILAMAYMWPQVGVISPPPGRLYFEPIAGSTGSQGLAVGFTIIDGRAIAVQASSNELLFAAARALAPAR